MTFLNGGKLFRLSWESSLAQVGFTTYFPVFHRYFRVSAPRRGGGGGNRGSTRSWQVGVPRDTAEGCARGDVHKGVHKGIRKGAGEHCGDGRGWLQCRFSERDVGGSQPRGCQVSNSVESMLASGGGFSRAERLFQLNQHKPSPRGVCRLPGSARAGEEIQDRIAGAGAGLDEDL